MTTDTKAVARWAVLGPCATMGPSESGEVVLFTDHERVVGELTREAKGLSQSLTETFKSEEELRAALAASRAEVEGLRKYRAAFVWAIQQTVKESTYETDFIELVAKIDSRENNNV